MPRSCWIDRASWLGGAALLIAVGSAASAQTPAQTAVREGVARKVYITALDDKGAPATDLTPQEITVKEDGASRNVLESVRLIDDSGPGIQDVREGIASFIRIVQASAEIAIVTTANFGIR